MRSTTASICGAIVSLTLVLGLNKACAADATANVLAHCQSCHGQRGESTSQSVPRLNGQQADYMKKRLRSFLDPGSQDPHATDAMWSIVRSVDDATLAEIAVYFAKQSPSPPDRRGPLAAAGARLYENGDRMAYIPACQACHGPQGQGRGTAPRLAGQHAAYLTSQLERLPLGLRPD